MGDAAQMRAGAVRRRGRPPSNRGWCAARSRRARRGRRRRRCRCRCRPCPARRRRCRRPCAARARSCGRRRRCRRGRCRRRRRSRRRRDGRACGRASRALMRSSPAPPDRRSLPRSSLSRSLPEPPLRRSSPAPPRRMSSPRPPLMTSSPRPPFGVVVAGLERDVVGARAAGDVVVPGTAAAGGQGGRREREAEQCNGECADAGGTSTWERLLRTRAGAGAPALG